MSLEDLLEALAYWGSVSVKRTRFPVAASSNLKGTPVLWSVAVRVPGYADKHGQPYFAFEHAEIKVAAENCYAAVEAYLFSDEGKAARRAAVKQREMHNDYALRTNPLDLPGHTASRQMGEICLDVIGPDAPPIRTETYR